MQSLNQIVIGIKNIAQEHAQINSFYFGSPMDVLSDRDVKYPLFCFDIVDFPISGKTASYPFQFWWLDIARADKFNELEVLSDMLLVSEDFIASLDDPASDLTLDRTMSRKRIEDTTPDGLAGVYADVTITQPITYDRCQIPTDKRIFTKEFEMQFE